MIKNTELRLLIGLIVSLVTVVTVTKVAFTQTDSPKFSIAAYKVTSSSLSAGSKVKTVKLAINNNDVLPVFNAQITLRKSPGYVTAEKKELYIGEIPGNGVSTTQNDITFSIDEPCAGIQLTWELIYVDSNGVQSEYLIVDYSFPTS